MHAKPFRLTDAQSAVAAEHFRLAFCAARRMRLRGVPADDALSIAGEALCRAVAAWDRDGRLAKLGAYLSQQCRSALSGRRSYRRGQCRAPGLSVADQSPARPRVDLNPPPGHMAAVRELTALALTGLTAKQREALWLTVGLGLTRAESGARMLVGEGAARTHAERGMSKARSNLGVGTVSDE